MKRIYAFFSDDENIPSAFVTDFLVKITPSGMAIAAHTTTTAIMTPIMIQSVFVFPAVTCLKK